MTAIIRRAMGMVPRPGGALAVPPRPTSMIPGGAVPGRTPTDIDPPLALPGRTSTDIDPPDGAPAQGRFPWGVAAGAAAAGAAGAAAVQMMGGDDPAAQPAPQAPDPGLQGKPGKQLSGDYHRKMWLDTMANRYRRDIAAGTVTLAQLAAEYDAGVANSQKQVGPIDPSQVNRHHHKAGALAARNITDFLSANRKAQIGLNVDKAWDQINLGRQMGVSRGAIIAMQDIQKSVAEGDHAGASAKMAMYGLAPDAYKSMAAIAAAAQEAKAKQPKEDLGVAAAHNKEMGIAMKTPPGMRMGAVRSVAVAMSGGKDADPAAVNAAVQAQMQPLASEMVSRGIGALSPEERMELQQVVGGMDYATFQRYTGQPDSPQTRDTYKKLTGKSTGLGDTLGSAAGTVIDYMVPDALWNWATGGGGK